MTTIRHATSLGLQAAGSGATLLASVAIAAAFGLAAQGEFALVKSWVDALATVCALGLPQGLLHLLYRGEAGEPALWRWTNRYLAGLLVAGGLAAALLHFAGTQAQATTLAAIAVAIPAAVGHQLWRSLVLRRRGVVVFAAITAAPALLLLACVGAWLVAGRPSGFGAMILLAWWAAAIATGLVARPPGASGGLAPSTRRELWSVSLQAALQAGAAALLPAALLSLAHRIGDSAAVVGTLSLCMQVYLLFAVAAAYVAPLVYDASARGRVDVATLLRRLHGLPATLRWGPPALAVAAPALLSLAWPAMKGRVALAIVLGLAGVAALYARVLSTIFQAHGRYAELSVQSLLRLAGACAACVGLGLAGMDAALAAGVALLAVELATVWRLVALFARPQDEPAPPEAATDAPRLILVTTNHPFVYTGGETMFVAGELPDVAALFPGMAVAPMHAVGDRLPLPENVRLDAALSRCWGAARWLWYLRAFGWPGFAHEFARAMRHGGTTGMLRVWRWSAQACAAWAWLQSTPHGAPLLLYTYWRGGATLACARLARERGPADGPVRVATRVHRYDLYEEGFSPPFQPWQSMYADLDRVFAISRDGEQALQRYGVDMARVRLARLGTAPARAFGGASTDDTVRLVSCSFMSGTKRVPLVACSAMELARRDPGRRVEWTHLGDGPGMAGVRAALRGAPANLDARLPGAVSHAAVLEHLGTRPVDVFVLLSTSEGLPVSVQEALAHAIPVVATDVGGVGEAVDGDVGCLLPADVSPERVADALARLVDEPPAERAARRDRALARWRRDFDAGANHRRFAAQLQAMLAAPVASADFACDTQTR